MADTLRDTFGVDSEMIQGKGGIFDVKLNGKIIFSKHQQDRFPTNDEVVQLIREAD